MMLLFEPSCEPPEQLRSVAPLERPEAGALELRKTYKVGELVADITRREIRPIAPVQYVRWIGCLHQSRHGGGSAC